MRFRECIACTILRLAGFESDPVECNNLLSMTLLVVSWKTQSLLLEKDANSLIDKNLEVAVIIKVTNRRLGKQYSVNQTESKR